MSDEGARDRGGPDERAWREVVDRTARSGGDCCERVEHLRTSRTEFDEVDEVGGGTSRTRTALVVLIVVAVPVILYSDLVTPNGATNYAGMGAGLVLMVVATLAHL